MNQPAAPPSSMVLKISIAGAALLLLCLGGYFGYKWIEKYRGVVSTVNTVKGVSTPTTGKIDVPFDPKLLKLVLGDDELAEAVLSLIDKYSREGKNLLSEEGVAVVVMMLPGKRESITMSILGAESIYTEKVLAKGYFEESLPPNIFERVKDASNLFGREMNFHSLDPKEKAELEQIYLQAKEGNMDPTAKFFEAPHKFGVILPNPKSVVKGSLGNDLETLAGSGLISYRQPTTFSLRAVCTDEDASRRVADFADTVKKLALIKLGDGANQDSRVNNLYTQFNSSEISTKGRVFQIKGVLPPEITSRGIASVPKFTDRLSKAQKGLEVRDASNMVSPRKTSAGHLIIDGAKDSGTNAIDDGIPIPSTQTTP
ncbi:MAG: hypothetical protein SGI71_08895 [Verrucomicrobiota bacterium]|nr:hypothetical protein [Verrucomicrobiota bacterium]